MCILLKFDYAKFGVSNLRVKATIKHHFLPKVSEWKNVMEELYRIASKAVQTRAAQGKQQYDKKVHLLILEPGD